MMYDGVYCEQCGGEVEPLGPPLGDIVWARCINCGWDNPIPIDRLALTFDRPEGAWYDGPGGGNHEDQAGG